MSAHRKIHRPLAEACVQMLEEIFGGKAMSDRTVGRALGAHPQWGARDRAFVADTVYEVVRWRRRLAWLAGADDWWSLAGMHWALRGLPRPEWAAWPDISLSQRTERLESLADAPRAVRESVSDELDALGEAELGAQWDAELAAMNRQADVFLRVNPLRSSPAAVTAELAEQNIALSPVEGAPLALRTQGGRGKVPTPENDLGRVAALGGDEQPRAVIDARGIDPRRGLRLEVFLQATVEAGQGHLVGLCEVEHDVAHRPPHTS